MNLEAQFHEAMVQLYHDTADAGINYRPTLLLQSVYSDGGLATAKRYLQDPHVTEGFKRLWAAGRLDLTVEHLVLQVPWRGSFTQEELEVAEQRLASD